MKTEKDIREEKADKELFDLIQNRAWFETDKYHSLGLELSHYSIGIKYKLIVWFANYLHPKRHENIKEPYTPFEQEKNIAKKLGTTYNSIKVPLKSLTSQGLFHRCLKEGTNKRLWSIGKTEDCHNCKAIRERQSIKDQKKEDNVKKIVTDGFAEVNMKRIEKILSLNGNEQIWNYIHGFIGNPDELHKQEFVKRYTEILTGFGIDSTSGHNDNENSIRKCDYNQFDNALIKYGINKDKFSSDCKNTQIISYIMKHIVPLIKNKRVMNQEIYITNMVKKYAELKGLSEVKDWKKLAYKSNKTKINLLY